MICDAIPLDVTVLRHCRCIDCRNWIGPPYSECSQGIIRNGLVLRPEFPADGWHYCARYRGLQVSKDVWLFPQLQPQTHDVGPCGDRTPEDDRQQVVIAY